METNTNKPMDQLRFHYTLQNWHNNTDLIQIVLVKHTG